MKQNSTGLPAAKQFSTIDNIYDTFAARFVNGNSRLCTNSYMPVTATSLYFWLEIDVLKSCLATKQRDTFSCLVHFIAQWHFSRMASLSTIDRPTIQDSWSHCRQPTSLGRSTNAFIDSFRWLRLLGSKNSSAVSQFRIVKNYASELSSVGCCDCIKRTTAGWDNEATCCSRRSVSWNMHFARVAGFKQSE